jgi:hypothetical protein
MKRWLLTLLLFVTIPLPSAQVIDWENRTGDHHKFLARAILNNWAPLAHVFILENQPLHPGVAGLCNQLESHFYIIQIAPGLENPTEVLLHELGHVIDFESGRLSVNPYLWDGEPAQWNLPWDKRPWELSADEWARCIRYEIEHNEVPNLPSPFIVDWFNQPIRFH